MRAITKVPRAPNSTVYIGCSDTPGPVRLRRPTSDDAPDGQLPDGQLPAGQLPDGQLSATAEAAQLSVKRELYSQVLLTFSNNFFS